jgi:glutamate-ammonia-ligase adenylyltransferase
MTAFASPADSPPSQANYSRFVQRTRRRYAALLPLLPLGLPSKDMMQDLLTTLQGQEYDRPSALRIMRHIVQERLITLDCEAGISLQDTTQGYTHLAEIALEQASASSSAQLSAQHGLPQGEQGKTCMLWIMGMGKLGARELNASSDIDIIFVYENEGQTTGNSDGRGQISNQEYFNKLVRLISTHIADNSEHGQVFRVDLALRPNGNSGPAAISLAALEEYFLLQGREWERLAWLKSRAVVCWPQRDKTRTQALTDVVIPFVFRKHLDYGVFEALRQLHAQIRNQAALRAAGKSAQESDVKLGTGGIREIEFICQLLQVVRGGQFAELRVRATLQALPALQQAGLMPKNTCSQLQAAYTFLRQVEHRIQYLDDVQTHTLPKSPSDMDWIARSLGLADVSAFFAKLQAQRDFVAAEFEQLLGGAQAQKDPASTSSIPEWEEIQTLVQAAAHDAPTEQIPAYASLQQQLSSFAQNPKVAHLHDLSRLRLLRVCERMAHWLAEGKTTPSAAGRFLDWVQLLLRHPSYLALLQERPSVLERLLRLLGAARWPARYLQRHPELIDELANRHMLRERFDAIHLRAELQRRHEALQAAGQADEETLLNVLRHAHHAEVFRTLARDAEGAISVEEVADDLSLLADTIVGITVDWCWQSLRQKHQDCPALGIIAYGKLGGKELGYGSDLDIVFVYDDTHENAGEIYAAFVRKFMGWMTAKTAAGDLFEIDTALRPNGNSGLLVTPFSAYADYQQQRGSNTAWLWEHQAMTRARCIWGTPELAQKFELVRQTVLCAPRELTALRHEIKAMRQRMRDAHKVPAGLFDVKHSAGGMVDCEFAVQYLVLAHAKDHPELIANKGNIALLQRAEDAQLLPAPIGEVAANAYRTLRRLQHKARLDEQATQIPQTQAETEQAAIAALWQAVFGSDAQA